MLHGYFDDSGSEKKKTPIFVLGGYILPEYKWIAFSRDWDTALKTKPSISFFKMSHAVMARGEFEGMPLELRSAKVRQLLDVVLSHSPDGIGTYICWREWTEFNNTLASKHRDPYGVLFFHLLGTVVDYLKETGSFPQKTQLDFDDQGRAGVQAIDWYERLQEGIGPFRLPREFKEIMSIAPRMLSDKTDLPLQAADLFAWSLRTRLQKTQAAPWNWIYQALEATLWRCVPCSVAMISIDEGTQTN